MQENKKHTQLQRLTSRKQIWLLNSIIVVIALGISLLAVELALRVRDPYVATPAEDNYQDWETIFEFSTTRHHKLRPNARWQHKELEYNYLWANNSLGMRDHERSFKKDPQSFRVLFLGDSMVQGYGVPQEQAMTSLLEANLNEPPREKTIEILNGGVFGYSPLLEYLYLKEIMPVVEPDIVIVGFFLGNDVGDDYFYTQQAQVDTKGELFFEDERWPWSYMNELYEKTVAGAASSNHSESSKHLENQSYLKLAWSKIRPLLMKSRLVRLIKETNQARHERQELKKGQELRQELAEKYKDDIRINLGLVTYPVLDQAQRLKYWQLSKGYLADIHRLCQEQNIPMVLVVIPGGNDEVFNEPYKILDEFGRELSVPIIQLLPEFRQYTGGELLYPQDGHWTPEGNRLAAAILNRELLSLNLLPPVRTFKAAYEEGDLSHE